VAGTRPPFDLQAHRGGLGLTVENTLEAFRTALAIGVTTLECDVHISRDGVPMVTHDRVVNPKNSLDTRPAYAGDPAFPYVGKLVTTLTADQLHTLDCGSLTHPSHPRQKAAPGARMPTLDAVFALLRERSADDVRLNIETKFDVVHPDETAPRERFVQIVAEHVRRAGLVERASIQSFDWGLLSRMRAVEPRLRLNALTSTAYLEIGRPGASPWLGGLDIDDFAGNLVAAAASLGFDAISPAHGDPYWAGVEDPAYRAFVTEAMVEQAHAAGMAVVPYTVDDRPTMQALLDMGVDGMITNYPDTLRSVLAERGLPLPPRYE
jgi:glycerophosphoryl diester phosphodiesterase